MIWAAKAASERSFWVIAIALVVAVAPAIATAVSGRLAEAATKRREAYAAAIGDLVAYAEYPFRIRRRTTDDPTELARLAALGNDLQERLQRSEAWIAGESRMLLERYQLARAKIATEVAPACREAWDSAPIMSAREMNIGEWGPTSVREELHALEQAIGARFGWRRLLRR